MNMLWRVRPSVDNMPPVPSLARLRDRPAFLGDDDMRFKMIFLAAILPPAFGMAGCNGLRSLTEPPDGLTGPYIFSMSTSLSNTAGTPTLLDAQLVIDRNNLADSCPQQYIVAQPDSDGNITFDCQAPAVSAVTLSWEGKIGGGTHTILFFISSQTTGASPSPYTVAAFTFQVRDAQGNLIKSIRLPTQSGNFANGQSIVYTITL
jgi:hypothetical protein